MTEFSIASYVRLLEELRSRQYEVVGYDQAVPSKRHLILRHDIDMSIEAARPVAEAEAALGCRSHYCVLLRSEMYNVFSPAARSGLQTLVASGHDVGLHFDASLYLQDETALDAAAAKECDLLESILERPVTLVSFHRPAQALLGRVSPIGGRLHTYMPKFFSEMGYCSDSQGEWRHGPPLAQKAVEKGRALQLLTHPIWWVTQGDTPVAKLQRFLNGRGEVLSAAMAANSLPFRRHLETK